MLTLIPPSQRVSVQRARGGPRNLHFYQTPAGESDAGGIQTKLRKTPTYRSLTMAMPANYHALHNFRESKSKEANPQRET